MNNFEEGIIYNGNIMKMEEGIPVLVEEQVKILYNGEEDTFFPFQSITGLLYFGSLIDDDKLKDKEIKEYHRKFMEGNYHYGTSANEGEKYIDENSITLYNINKRGR